MEMGSWGSNSYTFKEENKNIKRAIKEHTQFAWEQRFIGRKLPGCGGFSYTSSPYKNNINDGSLLDP